MSTAGNGISIPLASSRAYVERYKYYLFYETCGSMRARLMCNKKRYNLWLTLYIRGSLDARAPGTQD